MFRNGELTGHENASEVHGMHPLFKPFKLATFRLRYGRIRNEMANLRAPSSSQALQRTAEDDDDIVAPGFIADEPNNQTKSIMAEDESHIKEFTPSYVTFQWEHFETTVQHFTVAMIFPSSVQEKDIVPSVVKEGTVLSIVVEWPKPMIEMLMLHPKWLDKQFGAMSPYHPMIDGFRKSLKGLRTFVSSPVYSVCRISLPIVVETHIPRQEFLDFAYGSSVFHIDVKAPDDSYADTTNIACTQVQ
ncbi:hypothetical protein FGB62_147g011 [Gracilaria domingensis]|nr:hypothetical protein FGB62_147g011 [Gracilaria domingensis]